MAPLFLDSTIFLYAMGTEHPEKAPSIRLLELIADGSIEGVTSTEVLHEQIKGLRRISPAQAAA